MKDGTYSKNVQNCLNSDMFGSNVNHDQDSQDNVQESRACNVNNITCDFPCKLYNLEYYIDKLWSVYMLIYQDTMYHLQRIKVQL